MYLEGDARTKAELLFNRTTYRPNAQPTHALVEYAVDIAGQSYNLALEWFAAGHHRMRNEAIREIMLERTGINLPVVFIQAIYGETPDDVNYTFGCQEGLRNPLELIAQAINQIYSGPTELTQ